MSKSHEIKCLSQSFEKIISGDKKFDVRKNDRDYQPGDDITFIEYRPLQGAFTGRKAWAEIVYVESQQTDHTSVADGIVAGYCVIGIAHAELLPQ